MPLVAVGEIAGEVQAVEAAEFLPNDDTMARGEPAQPPQTERGLLVHEVVGLSEEDAARAGERVVECGESHVVRIGWLVRVGIERIALASSQRSISVEVLAVSVIASPGPLLEQFSDGVLLGRTERARRDRVDCVVTRRPRRRPACW
jgi:hypothetical protein